MTSERMNVQQAPYPDALDALVQRIRYRPGWRFALSDIERDPADTHGAAAGGLTFIVTTLGYDSYHPDRGENYRVNHYFPVPAATYNEASWLRWLLDCLLKVEQHETCEFFALDNPCCLESRLGGHADGCAGPFTPIRPFAPTHGPGDDPYIVHEYATDRQARTSFRGQIVGE